MKTIPSLLTCLAIALATVPAQAASKFYKWTDEQGVTHYTIDPPPATAKASSEVKVRQPYTSADAPAAPADSKPAGGGGAAGKDDKAKGKDKEKDKEKDKDKAKKDDKAGDERYAERCEKLRADLQTIQEHARVRVTDTSGEARTLSDEEKTAKQDEIQRQIKAFCE